MTPADIAVENVESLIAGRITDPSPGTLAAHVLDWANGFEGRRVKAWEQSAAEFCSGMEFYRGIVHQVGEMFGVAARTSDDGSIQDSVLALKVPELVAAVLAENSRHAPIVTLTVLDPAPL